MNSLYIVLGASLLALSISTYTCDVPVQQEAVQELTGPFYRLEDWRPIRISHYGATGNPMANGEMPYVGAAAISDYSYPVKSGNVKARVLGEKTYDVKDRTARYIQGRFGITTLDLYTDGTDDELRKLGVRYGHALIYTE